MPAPTAGMMPRNGSLTPAAGEVIVASTSERSNVSQVGVDHSAVDEFQALAVAQRLRADDFAVPNVTFYR